jgi:hypothetical protein
MSRSGYSDDYGDDDPLAMPDKRLVAGELEADGQFCALGVVGQARGLNLANIDTYDVESLGPKFNIAEQLAREIMWVNDEHVSEHRWVDLEICGPVRPGYPDWGRHKQSVCLSNEHAGEERWQTVRKWVASHIRAAAQEAAGQSVSLQASAPTERTI